ncbi:MAG: hypothetical protein JJ863_15515 [Deltaproteobacteria bacterium]|nr:hypothetical protein [Deltaproteobacteria bacterium]
MAKKPKRVVCTACNLGQDQVLKQTFLGFYTFQCEECGEKVQYPLSATYVAIYALSILSLFGLFFGRGACGVLAVGGVVALALDVGIRRRVKAAEAHERTRGEVIAETFE